MHSLAVATAAWIISTAFGIRMRRQKRRSPGSSGRVDGLYPAAAPCTASPPLENPQSSDGCFPGIRTWTARKQWWGDEVDQVVTIAGVIGYRHPYMDGYHLDVKYGELKFMPCNSDSPNIPRGTPKDDHNIEKYISHQERISGFMFNISNVMRESETYSKDEARATVATYGWNLVDSVVDEGGAIYVGRQVSHLLQNPDNLECILTFQGSASIQDWMANLAVKKTHFCGLVSADQECVFSLDGKCTVDRPGESFVHKGFRDALREIVQNSEWQNRILPKLGYCAKVYVTGHSLGAAQSELFAACAARDLKPGDFGYEEDYKYIHWIRDTPQLLEMV